MGEREIIIKKAAQYLIYQRNMEKRATGAAVAKAPKAWKNLFKYLGLANLVGIPVALNLHNKKVNQAREQGGMMTYQRLLPWMMAMNAPQGGLSSPYSFQNTQGMPQGYSSNPAFMG